MGAQRPSSSTEFFPLVRDYWTSSATIRETTVNAKPGALVSNVELNEHTFYWFDSDAFCALCHAVQDIALEAGRGSMVASLQDFNHFEFYREGLCQLGATIDRVEVIGFGTKPSRARRVRFLPDLAESTRSYWAMTFQSEKDSILVAGKEYNQADRLEDQEFVGFVSSNPSVVARFTEDLRGLLDGKCPQLSEFARLASLDRAAKEIQTEITLGGKALEQAVQALTLGRNPSPSIDISTEILTRGMARLQELKTQLPSFPDHAPRS